LPVRQLASEIEGGESFTIGTKVLLADGKVTPISELMLELPAESAARPAAGPGRRSERNEALVSEAGWEGRVRSVVAAITDGSTASPGQLCGSRGAAWFTAPAQVNQRRYEALRAYFTEGLTYEQAGERFGYTRWAMIGLVREHRAGILDLFAPPRRPGPPPGTAPAKDRARSQVIELRRRARLAGATRA
jgi:hypothetical protein